MTVSREAFEAQLARVEAECADPRHGLYGPGTITWRISREAALFINGGRASLLQLAHPYVAHAIDQHSQTRTDPIGRFNRTFQNVYAMVFGDLDHALGSARRVRMVHDMVYGRIREDVGVFPEGHRYQANDADALLWVHATLIDSAVLGYELLVEPLTAHEKEAYYQESKRFARLFGIPEHMIPPGWDDFQGYMRRMFDSDVLHVGEPASEIARFLLTPPNHVTVPVIGWYRVITAGLLPPRLRAEFGFRWTKRDELLLRASQRALRPAWKALPKRLRYVPAYVEAKRRLEGHEGPDRFGRALEKVLLSGIAPAKGRG